MNKRLARIPRLQDLGLDYDLLDFLHLGARPVLRGLGIRQETRRLGEVELGLWRRPVGAVSGPARLAPRRIVVIPGFGDSPFSWVGGLAAHWRTLKDQFDEWVWLDFPAFSGLLKRKRGFDSISQLESAVFDVLDSLKPELLLGHSMGGWLAAAYAWRCARGDRPRAIAKKHYSGPSRLVLVDPAGFFLDEEHLARWQATFRRADEQGFEPLRPALFHREPRWFKWVAPGFGAFLEREEVRAFLRSVEERHHLTRGQLGEIRARSWVIWGEGDALMGPGVGEAWVESIRAGGGRCDGVAIAEAGHGPQVEQPLEFGRCLKRILAERGGI